MTVGFMRSLRRGDAIQTAGGIAVTSGTDVIALRSIYSARAEIAAATLQERERQQISTTNQH